MQRLSLSLVFSVLSFFLPLSLFAGMPEGQAVKPAPTQPLSFIENKGQITDQYRKSRNDIDFKLDAGNGLVIFVGSGQIHYQWTRATDAGLPDKSLGNRRVIETGPEPVQIETYRMDVVLEGADIQAPVIAREQQAFYEQYYTDRFTGGLKVHSYTRIVYKNVYPNIDWVLYTRDGGLKYDFVVHAGGDPADIRLRYKGATELQLQEEALIATTPLGSITEAKPYSYTAETEREIPSAFRLTGDLLQFDIDAGSKHEALIIDPSLKWASYFGGSNQEGLAIVTTDTMGNAFLGGGTYSISNIATVGAHQVTFGGNAEADAYLTKYNVNGVVLWATYYGGSDEDIAIAVSADIAGNIYLGGYTESLTGISTPGAFQPAPTTGTGRNGFLVKFNASGTRQWGTYFGGTSPSFSSNDDVSAISCDLAGNIYIGGATNSSSGIATTGAFQTSFGNGFLAKFSSSGSRLWATYYNGSIISIACYGNSLVYIGGGCGPGGTSGIATTGAHQTVNYISSSATDGFIGCLTASGTSRLWGTYYSTSGYDLVAGLRCDASGHLYVTGYSWPATNMSNLVTTGAFLTTSPGGGDVYLGKFNSAGNRLWSTLYGGSGYDYASGIALSANGDVYVAGSTTSANGIASPNAHQGSLSGPWDHFITCFSPNGNRKWGTYYGGPSSEAYYYYYGTLASGKNLLYLAGSTSSSSGISTPGSQQQTYGGGGDAYLAQFDMDTTVYVQQPFADTLLCTGDSIRLAYAVTHHFRSNNVFTIQLSNATGSFANPTVLGTVTGNTGGMFRSTLPTGVAPGNGYRIRIVASAPIDTSNDNLVNIRTGLKMTKPVITASANPVCAGQPISLSAAPLVSGAGYTWYGPAHTVVGSGSSYTLPAAALSDAGAYRIVGTSNVCSSGDTLTIGVKPLPATPVAGSNSPVCMGGSLQLTASSATPGVSYSWTGPGGFTANQQNPVISPVTTAHSGNYTVTAGLNGCTASAGTAVQVNVVATVGAYASPGETICTGSMATFVAMPQNAGPNPSYAWFKNGVQVGTNNTYSSNSLVTGDKIWCSVTISAAQCNGAITVSTDTFRMTVNTFTVPPEVVITASPGTAVSPTENVYFTAVAVHGGTNPEYDWYKNGSLLPGVRYASVSLGGLYFGDEIVAVLHSSYPCASPKTASDTIIIGHPTGIKGTQSKGGLRLYPNPNKGSFTISGVTAGELNVSIVNALGQEVYSARYAAVNGSRAIDASLVPGNYLIKLQTEQGMEVLRFAVD